MVRAESRTGGRAGFTQQCHHNECSNIGSGVSHFNVSLIWKVDRRGKDGGGGGGGGGGGLNCVLFCLMVQIPSSFHFLAS